MDVNDTAGGRTTGSGQRGHTGGTISDLRMYKASCPGGIWLWGMPGGNEDEYVDPQDAGLDPHDVDASHGIDVDDGGGGGYVDEGTDPPHRGVVGGLDCCPGCFPHPDHEDEDEDEDEDEGEDEEDEGKEIVPSCEWFRRQPCDEREMLPEGPWYEAPGVKAGND
jgi:hypothetical protein